MKRPLVAFLLSFLLAGAGLWYLGKWKYGFINLGIILMIGFILTICLPEELFDKWIHYAAAGCACGSGALAQFFAQQMNERIKNETESPRNPH